MINYIWFGLIVIAVVFAGYKDATNVPVRSGPDPLVILAEGSPVSLQASAGEEVIPLIPGLPRTLDKAEHLGKDIAVSHVALSISGTGGPVRVEASFTDSAGRVWVGRFPLRSLVEEPTVTKLDLATLRCADDPLETKVQHPLVLDHVVIHADGEDAGSTLAVTVHRLALDYPTSTPVRSSVEASTWMGVMTSSSADWAAQAVTLAINLIGIMMLWLGLMKIAEAAGLVQIIARAVKPVMVLLFPAIPADGPAMGAIVMNVAANILGLGNAATPMGLKAMQELQELNANKEYASNAMCMLLSINTAGVQLIPATIIGFRAAAGSTDMLFWPLMIVATTFSTAVAVIVCKLLEGLPAFRVPEAISVTEEKNQ